jgi:hypothetical protein
MNRIVKTYEVFNEQGEEWWDKGGSTEEGDNEIFASPKKGPGKKPIIDPRIDPLPGSDDDLTQGAPGPSYINPDFDDFDDQDFNDDGRYDDDGEREDKDYWKDHLGQVLDNLIEEEGIEEEDILEYIKDYFN